MIALLTILAVTQPASEGFVSDALSISGSSLYYAHEGDSKLVKFGPAKSIVNLPFKLPQFARYVKAGATEYIYGYRTNLLWVKSKGQWSEVHTPGYIHSGAKVGSKLVLSYAVPSKSQSPIDGPDYTVAVFSGEKMTKKWPVQSPPVNESHPFFITKSHVLKTISNDGSLVEVCKLANKPGNTRWSQNQYVIATTNSGALIKDVGQMQWVTLDGKATPFKGEATVTTTSGSQSGLWTIASKEGKHFLVHLANGKRQEVELKEPNATDPKVSADSHGATIVFRPKGESSTAAYVCLVKNGKLSLRLTNAEGVDGLKSQIKVFGDRLYYVNPEAGLKSVLIPNK